MALSLWTRAQLQARIFADLVQQDSDDNLLVIAAQVQDALYLGEQQFARDARTLKRTVTMTAVDEQVEYAAPEDTAVIVDITWNEDTTPLTETDEAKIAKGDKGYRQEAAGTPSYWYPLRAGHFGLYPPGSVTDETLTLDIYCMPLSIGGSLASITRVTTTITVTTAGVHNLRIGDSVTASGTGTTEFNTAHTVVTVPSTATFTATLSAAAGADTAAVGYLYYTGGELPMLAAADVPNLSLKYRMAPAFFAEWWLSQMQLSDDPVSFEAGKHALERYLLLMREYLGESAI